MKITLNDAGNGDCLLIQSQNTNLLIDGGTAGSYRNWKNTVLAQKRLDCVIVTHIDSDHVNGIIKLLASIKKDDFHIEQILYNGVSQILDLDYSDTPEEIDNELETLAARFVEISDDEEKIGASEGTSLSYLIHDKKITTNSSPIYRTKNENEKVKIGQLQLQIIGPDERTLSELKNLWFGLLKDDLIVRKAINKSHSSAFESYINSLKEEYISDISSSSNININQLSEYKYEHDNSLPNKSSLAFLIKDENSSCLFLGDCHAETVLDWLNDMNFKTLEVDAIKLSHHGSKKNINKELVQRIRTNKYLISTNGNKFSHPDLETLSLIAKHSNSNDKEIYINNEISHITDDFIKKLKEYNTTIFMNHKEIEL